MAHERTTENASQNFSTSPYIDYYFKHFTNTKLDLATSGRKERRFEEFQAFLDFDKLFDNKWRGSEDRFVATFLARYSQSSGIDLMCVPGTSGANYVAQNALVGDGDLIAIESPLYDPLAISAINSNKKVIYFDRGKNVAFMPDINSLRKALEAGARFVVLTNLHNPSGAYLSVKELSEIAKLLDQFNAIALVDEVYLEFLPNWEEKTALNVSPRFIISSSLTKVYGLSELSTGWLAGSPKNIEQCRKFFLTITGHNSSPGMEMAVQLAPRLPTFIEKDKKIIDTNRQALQAWTTSHNIELIAFDYSPICLIKLPSGLDDREFCDFANNTRKFFLAPGSFFGVKNHIRIGLFKDASVFRTALELLSKLMKMM